MIHAASGGVGTLLVQLAKRRGAEVIAKVGSTEKEVIVKNLGADQVINYKTKDYVEEINSTTKLDVSFNPVGGSTFKKDWNHLAPGGKLYLFGGAELSSRFGIFSSLNFLRKMGILIPAALMMTSKSILGVNMLKIADEKIFALLCSDEGYPNDTLIAERRVREDWTVTCVFFPSQGILWITEIEW